jgi:hypothetical protein
VFRDVPVDEVKMDEVKTMLHTNCKALYGLDHIPDRLPSR